MAEGLFQVLKYLKKNQAKGMRVVEDSLRVVKYSKAYQAKGLKVIEDPFQALNAPYLTRVHLG